MHYWGWYDAFGITDDALAPGEYCWAIKKHHPRRMML